MKTYNRSFTSFQAVIFDRFQFVAIRLPFREFEIGLSCALGARYHICRKPPQFYRIVKRSLCLFVTFLLGLAPSTGHTAQRRPGTNQGLERDFFELMTQDPLYDVIDWKPVTIHYTGRSGAALHYTPDALVSFKLDPTTNLRRLPLLAEIKYREEYRKKLSELRERFQIARIYARELGGQFKVVTEREIRTASFSNRRFWRYRPTAGSGAYRRD